MLDKPPLPAPLNILLVDADISQVGALRDAVSILEREVRVTFAGRLRGALEAMKQPGIRCVITDVELPDANGIRIVRAMRRAASGIPVIVMTAASSVSMAVEALKHGASDYVLKGPDCASQISVAVRESLGRSVLAGLDELVECGPSGRAYAGEGFVATTPRMRQVLGLVERAASSAVPVLIEGETGTGKEFLARAVHERGRRRSAPFLVQNCAALTESLLESELFGHVRGAFTGAERDRRGLFDEAGEGTVFLDEIGEAPLSVQAKLLRVLQNAEVKPVGADRTHRVRARVVAATNRRLIAEVRAGRFREDLLFRLTVFPIHVPPLRHRAADVVPLVELTLRRFEAEESRQTGGVGPQALRMLQEYPWPGNVRELEHEIHRIVLTVPAGERIRPHHLARRIREHVRGECDDLLTRTLARVELAVIQDRLRRYPSKAAAARSLGITREALYAKLRRLGNISMSAET